MVYRLDFHPEAEAEFDEALLWYQKEKDGLEQAFFDDYLSIEARIEDAPHHFPAVLENIRRANFSRFPYSVFFEIEPDSVFIFAIFHQSRNPEEWKGRV